jgi:hypothetical protein
MYQPWFFRGRVGYIFEPSGLDPLVFSMAWDLLSPAIYPRLRLLVCAASHIPGGLLSLFPSVDNDIGLGNASAFAASRGIQHGSKPAHANSFGRYRSQHRTPDSEQR